MRACRWSQACKPLRLRLDCYEVRVCVVHGHSQGRCIVSTEWFGKARRPAEILAYTGPPAGECNYSTPYYILLFDFRRGVCLADANCGCTTILLCKCNNESLCIGSYPKLQVRYIQLGVSAGASGWPKAFVPSQRSGGSTGDPRWMFGF